MRTTSKPAKPDDRSIPELARDTWSGMTMTARAKHRPLLVTRHGEGWVLHTTVADHLRAAGVPYGRHRDVRNWLRQTGNVLVLTRARGNSTTSEVFIRSTWNPAPAEIVHQTPDSRRRAEAKLTAEEAGELRPEEPVNEVKVTEREWQLLRLLHELGPRHDPHGGAAAGLAAPLQARFPYLTDRGKRPGLISALRELEAHHWVRLDTRAKRTYLVELTRPGIGVAKMAAPTTRARLAEYLREHGAWSHRNGATTATRELAETLGEVDADSPAAGTRVRDAVKRLEDRGLVRVERFDMGAARLIEWLGEVATRVKPPEPEFEPEPASEPERPRWPRPAARATAAETLAEVGRTLSELEHLVTTAALAASTVDPNEELRERVRAVLADVNTGKLTPLVALGRVEELVK